MGGAGAADGVCGRGTGFGKGCICGKAGGISGGVGLKIILASQSPRRQELLRQMGVRFRVVTADVTEEHGTGRAARAICKRNALAKA
ncbi:MAG: Maf family protein, partial [Verrucomicrobiia bacterium]